MPTPPDLSAFRTPAATGRPPRGLRLGLAAALAVVWFAVLGLGGPVFGAIGDAASRSRDIEARRLALLTARSILAVGMTGNESGAGRVTGVDGNFVWELTAAPAAAGAPSTAGELVRLEVRVRDRAKGAELARLATLRLAEGA